jgi:hypothetical protein
MQLRVGEKTICHSNSVRIFKEMKCVVIRRDSILTFKDIASRADKSDYL